MFKQAIRSLQRRVFGMIDRGVLTLVNDSLARQQVQIKTLDGELSSHVDRWQQYGHTSVPPDNSEQLVVALNGNRSNLAVICAEDKNARLKDLIEGDSALYHLEGHFFKLTKDGVLEGIGEELNLTVKRVNIIATEEVNVTSPLTKFSGDVEIGGDSHVKGSAMTDGDSLTLGDSITDGMVTGVKGGLFKGVSAELHKHKENQSVTDIPT